MNNVRSMVESFGFQMTHGPGGAEQYRRFSARTVPIWLVLTKENDTLSVPSELNEHVNLAIFYKDPDDPRSNPHKELLFSTTEVALVHVLRNYAL